MEVKLASTVRRMTETGCIFRSDAGQVLKYHRYEREEEDNLRKEFDMDQSMLLVRACRTIA